MITFDKLKLVADITAVIEFDDSQFEKTEKNGSCTYKYYQDVPYLLAIKIDFPEKEVVIEFTGKILGSDYPKLISMNTIRQCFQAINSIGIVTLDVEVMMDADVVKCDVTKDIHSDDVPKLTNYVRQHISNYQKYICRKLRNNNLVVEKNVVTRKMKKRMTIYDKGKEMQKEENQRFVEAYYRSIYLTLAHSYKKGRNPRRLLPKYVIYEGWGQSPCFDIIYAAWWNSYSSLASAGIFTVPGSVSGTGIRHSAMRAEMISL